MLRLLVIIILATLVVATSGDPVYAANPPFRIQKNDFLVTKWTTENGLPQNTVTSIVQSRDGYIWLGTFGGLVRFDGVRFTVYDSANSPALKSNRILSLYEDSWERLWIGTDKGEVYTLKDGRFDEVASVSGFERRGVWGFQDDAIGNLYISSDGGLERIPIVETAAQYNLVAVLARGLSFGICRDRAGIIWTRVENNTFLIQNGELINARSRGINAPEYALKWAPRDDGRVYVASNEVLGYIDGGHFNELQKLVASSHNAAISFGVHGDTVWFQQPGQLIEFNGDNAIRHDLKEIVDGGTRAIFFDRENNMWLGTNGEGLVKMVRRKIGLLSELIDIKTEEYYTIAEDKNETVWIGGTSLIRVKNGEAARFDQISDGKSFPLIKSVAIDKDDRLWVGGEGGLFVLSGDKLVRQGVLGTESIYSLFFDRSGVLWAGGKHGLWRLENGKLVHFTAEDGLANDSVHRIEQTRDGTIWIGTMDGISKYHGGRFENITTAQGLTGGFVREIFEDDDGTIWIGTYGGGINRLQNGAIKTISTSNGLPDNFISRIVADNNGKFWILGNLGIISVDKTELNSVADGTKPMLVSGVFDTFDGMPSAEANGAHQYAGIIARDGRLWFPMTRDVVVVDPTKLEIKPQNVVIERAWSRSGSEVQDYLQPAVKNDVIRLGSGIRNLEIEFTLLTFTKSDKTRFLYKLDGVDDGWTDAGTRRQATYPYLPSGEFTFLVKAIAADGSISEVPTKLSIAVEKYAWETWWFRGLLALAVAILIVIAYRVRVRQLKARERKQEAFSRSLMNAHEFERQRIATELHDGLGQNLLVIKNLARAAAINDVGRHEMQSSLGQISEIASETIADTREMVGNLSPQNLRRFGLTASIRNMIEQVERATGISFESRIADVDGVFPEQIELSVFRMVQESLNNIIKHSDSPRGIVIIEKYGKFVSIAIEDVGRGFDVSSVLEYGGEKAGFGLRNLVQRVNLAGGEISIDSAEDAGTKISIKLNL